MASVPSRSDDEETSRRGGVRRRREAENAKTNVTIRGNGRKRARGGFRTGAIAFSVLIALVSARLCESVTFNRCAAGCSVHLGRGACGVDGVCECAEGWMGLSCDVPTPSVGRETRIDGTVAYTYDTTGTAFGEKHVSDMLLDIHKSVVYVYAQDSVGIRIIEVDPRSPETFSANGFASRGWGPGVGPRREPTGAMPLSLAPSPGFCGPGTSSSCPTKHPRAYGHVDPIKSRGWYGVYAKLSADISTTLTGVIAPVNMWHATTENRFKFVLYKYQGTACSSDDSQWSTCVLGSSNNGAYSKKLEIDEYILDALGVDESSGRIVYKGTHQSDQRGIIGMVNANLENLGFRPLDPSLLKQKCPDCALQPDAMRIETSMPHNNSVGRYVIFAGSTLLNNTASKIFYPNLFKVNSQIINGQGDEMYLDLTSVKLTAACEGQFDAKQGRFSTFTAMTKHNGYGYVGTSGRDEDCANCHKRAACIFMFDLNFQSGDGPLAMIALDPELGERDALSATVQEGSGPGEKDYMYWTVGSRDGNSSRIVKIEIGGTDTSSGCTSGCFRRVGTFEESFVFGGITKVPGEHAIFAASAGTATTYSKYSTVTLTSIEPTHVMSTTAGTAVTIHGSGFYSKPLSGGLSHSISCRFGHRRDANDGFLETGWSPATYLTPNKISCAAPSAASSNSLQQGYSEVEISFDGFPSDRNDPTNVWEGSLWSAGNLNLRYHDPAVVTNMKIGSNDALALFTGEDDENTPVKLSVFGGPYINSPNLKCKFNDDPSSVTSATFISATEITCPICQVSGGRCNNPVGSPLPWLVNGVPQTVNVAVTLNGVDYSDSKGSLTLHGPPAGVKVLDRPPSYRAHVSAANFSPGTFKVALVDINGTIIPYDRNGQGTTGYRISATIAGASSVNVTEDTASSVTSSGETSLVPVLTAVPVAGEYKITFSAADCSSGTCATSLSILDHAQFSVRPGQLAGLMASPGGVTESSLSNDALFPSDGIILRAGLNISIGSFTIDIVDVAENALQSLSENEVTVNASIVTRGANGVYAERSLGAELAGTLMKVTTDGRVLFDDLSLVARAPSGSRAIGSNDDIMYDDATRGDFGELSKYIIQFKAVLNGVPLITHSIVRIDPGDPVYLRINGTYSKRTLYAEGPTQSTGEIIIGAYDGGNNFVGSAEVDPRTVKVEASPGINLGGTLEVSRDYQGVWRFADLAVLSPTVGEFSLTFSSPDLTSVKQIINMLPGNAGYKCVSSRSVLPAIVADKSVTLGSFTIDIQDMTGTALGTGDRYATTDSVAPNRTIQVTSETLALSGSDVLYTNGNGQVSVAGLVADYPKVGTHILKVVEVSADVGGETRSPKLQSTMLNVTVTIGQVKGFKVSSPTRFEYASSFTESIQASEASKYSAGDTVPLSDFVIVPTDGAGNESPLGTMPSGITLTATLNDTSSGYHPYILGANKTTVTRDSVLTVFPDTTRYPRVGSLSEITSSAGTATFSGLHLVKPMIGIYNLTFTSADPNLSSASVLLTIVAGASKHLGLLPYCSTREQGCQIASNCTCQQYSASAEVSMHPFIANILDGGFNPVGIFETRSCETCKRRAVQLSSKTITLCRATESGGCECAGVNSTTSKLGGKLCSSVVTLDVITRSGQSFIDGLIVPTPSVGTYSVSVQSPGLLGVEYFFQIVPGEPENFMLAQTQASEIFVSSLHTKITNATHPLVGKVYDGGGNFLSTSTHGAQITVRCKTATLEDYPQGIHPIIGGSNYAISCANITVCSAQASQPGIVEFKNLALRAPSAGEHNIEFYMHDVLVATYGVTVSIGTPAKLFIANSPKVSYSAKSQVVLEPHEIAITDVAGNLLGVSNTVSASLVASISGPRHTFSASGRTSTLAVGDGSVLFSNLALGTPEAGNYVITFSCSNCGASVAAVSRTFAIVPGAPSALDVLTAFTIPGVLSPISLQTEYETAKEVRLGKIQVRAVDAGLNAISSNHEISVAASPVAIGDCTSETNFSYTPRTTIGGAAIFDDLVFYRPCTGNYSLTFSAPGMDSASLVLRYRTGYPAALDACSGNSFSRVERSLCRDPTSYFGAPTITLRSFVLRMTDPGGYPVGSTWDAEARNITAELVSFTPEKHQLQSAMIPTLRAQWNGSLLAVNGEVGWCENTEDTNPTPVLTIDPATGAHRYSTVYTNPAPSYCRELSYSGVAPDTHYNVGLKIENALAGVYRLRFTSTCSSNRCPGAVYPILEDDTLEFTVLPGIPTALKVVTPPPFINENDFKLVPEPVIAAVDSIGNVCTDMNATLVRASLTPTPAGVSGTQVTMVDGIATFGSLKIVGTRGVDYQLEFSVVEIVNVTNNIVNVTADTAVTIMNCSTVKPNSGLDGNSCSCLPGFTGDVSGDTGDLDDLKTRYVESNMTLYKNTTSGSLQWLHALHPYGVCVPCKNGFYKETLGDVPCTSCPKFMDTSRENGRLKQNYTTSSGIRLAGSLGQASKSACHCISQTTVPFDSYYRKEPMESYSCAHCPNGAKCNGDGIENMETLPGFYRYNPRTLEFRACPYAEACLGGINSTCLDKSYTGAQCAACSDGYAFHFIRENYPPKCYDCSKGLSGVLSVPILIMNFIWIVLLTWAIYKVNKRRGSQAVNMIKSFITYLQMTGLAKNLDLDWPISTKAFLLIAEKLSLPDTRSVPQKCALGWSFYQNLLFHEALPLGLMVFLFIIFTASKYVEELKEERAKARVEATKTSQAKDSAEEEGDEKTSDETARKPSASAQNLAEGENVHAYDLVISWLVTMLWLLYPVLVQYLVEFTQCTGDFSAADRHLVSDYSLRCAGSTYSLYLTVVIILVFVYILGIPLLLLKLAQREDVAREHKSVGVQYKFGVLFKGLEMKTHWWWEWIIFVRKFVLITIVIIFRGDATMGGYTVNCFLQIFFVFHIVSRPYASEEHAKIETYGLLATTATFTSGLIFKQSYNQSTGMSSVIVQVITALLLALHAWTWYTFVRILRNQFYEESQEGLIKRAIRDLEFEDAIVKKFEASRVEEITHAERLHEQRERIQLQSMAGQRLPFADDELLATIKRDSTIEIREEHRALSSKLRDLRDRWKARMESRGSRHVPLDERHLTTARARRDGGGENNHSGEDTPDVPRWRRHRRRDESKNST